MTDAEADAYLADYRALLKAWTMALAGLSRDDSEELGRRLEAGRTRLAEIATHLPQKSYSVDLLINARSRTWAGFAAERVARPADRHP